MSDASDQAELLAALRKTGETIADAIDRLADAQGRSDRRRVAAVPDSPGLAELLEGRDARDVAAEVALLRELHELVRSADTVAGMGTYAQISPRMWNPVRRVLERLAELRQATA